MKKTDVSISLLNSAKRFWLTAGYRCENEDTAYLPVCLLRMINGLALSAVSHSSELLANPEGRQVEA